jgi:BASS family bile acid:Na+ symporter
VGRAGTALLALGALLILVRAWPAMAALFGDGTMLTLGAFTAIGIIAGHVFGGPPDEERTALALACSTRHPAIALSIAVANFPSSPRVAPTILLYVLVSGAVSAGYLQWLRRQARSRHHRLSILR